MKEASKKDMYAIEKKRPAIYRILYLKELS